MKAFKEELEELEENGWIYKGDLPCPQVGGDHDCELWVNPNNVEQQAEVCELCGNVNYK